MYNAFIIMYTHMYVCMLIKINIYLHGLRNLNKKNGMQSVAKNLK